MNPRAARGLRWMAAVLFLVACRVSLAWPGATPPTPGSMAQPPAPTLTHPASPAAVDAAQPTLPSPATPTAQAAPSPTATPVVARGLMPAYIWVRADPDGTRFVLYDGRGQPVLTWQRSPEMRRPLSPLHTLQPIPPDEPEPEVTIAYWGASDTEMGFSVVRVQAGTHGSLGAVAQSLGIGYLGLTGEPGGDLVVYSLVYFHGPYLTRTRVVTQYNTLYARHVDTDATYAEYEDDAGYGPLPLGVDAGRAWFTWAHVADATLPHLGLWAEGLDPQSVSLSIILNRDTPVVGFNAALRWVAYTHPEHPNQLRWQPVTRTGLAEPQILGPEETLPPRDAVIGTRYIAWRVQDEAAHTSRLRIFTLGGQPVLVETPRQPLAPKRAPMYARPVAWLESPDGDQRVLVLEGLNPQDGTPLLALFPPQTDGEVVFLPGAFAGVAYPYR